MRSEEVFTKERLSFETLEKLGYKGYLLKDAPEKIVQFGEGNFLRAFADNFIDLMNEKAGFNAKVVLVQPRGGHPEAADRFSEQDGLYTLILRGRENGQPVEHTWVISAASRCLDPKRDWEKLLDCARNPELRFVISNTTIGGSITIDDMFRDGYQSVFVGAGLWKPRSLHIKGESLGHVAFAINYLACPEAFRLGERVIVIGSGNSAMDCARTAIRQGARYVTVFNRRDKIAASQYESSYAKLEGVTFEMMKVPVEILEDSVVFADSEFDEEGKLRPVPGSEKRYPCTGVIVAVSQELGGSIVSGTADIGTKPSGLLVADEDGRTSRPGVFAAGDAAHGARTVVEAVANGKRVAEAMHAYMQSLPMPEPSAYSQLPIQEAVEPSVLAEQVL